MERTRVTMLKEVVTTVTRFPESYRKKKRGENNEESIANVCFGYLLSDESFLDQFGNKPITSPEAIGRGWHGVTYKIGNYVMKVQHEQGPVEGFEYPQTRDGAQLAQEHLETMQMRAQKHNLPYLIPKDQGVFFVPVSNDDTEGRVVTIQEYYSKIYTPKDVTSLLCTKLVRQQLRRELQNFISFYKASAMEDGLMADVFGLRNLVLREIDGALHFVLLDVGPVDRKIAGPIAQVGMSAAFIKEILKWQAAFALGSLRRKQRTI